MTSDEYRMFLVGRKCPKCGHEFSPEDMGMKQDIRGYEIDDFLFRYILFGHCPNCRTVTTFRELGIPEASPGRALKLA